MKSQRGITLTSLAIYIVLIFVVLAILATVTLNFQSGVKEITKEGTEIAEINKFNMYFLQEVKKQGNEIDKITNDEILFATGNKYTFKYDNNIYLNDSIKIAENIEKCIFSNNLENGRNIIKVTIKVKGLDEQVIDYVLNSDKFSENYNDQTEYIK